MNRVVAVLFIQSNKVVCIFKATAYSNLYKGYQCLLQYLSDYARQHMKTALVFSLWQHVHGSQP